MPVYWKWMLLLFLLCTACAQPGALQAQNSRPEPKAVTPRSIVVISDLHFGIGKTNGEWDNLEDFRWPKALQSFLAELGRRFPDGVDLVVAGDLLELWQHPKVRCHGCGADLGCTQEDAVRITADVVSAHGSDLRMFGTFADGSNNRLFIIPGNHDATLTLDNVWQTVLAAMQGTSGTNGRIERVKKGVWASDDGLVVVEHGHQIDPDVNRYKTWPEIVEMCAIDNQDYVARPWGELFVQKLYNDVEGQFPIIDNLIPESAGAAIYSKYRGFWGSAVDMARFVSFNLFQVSLRQKIQLNVSDPTKADAWNVNAARGQGFRLFVDSLDPDDPLRKRIVEGQEPESQALREELERLALPGGELSDETVLALCDSIKLRKGQRPDGDAQLCPRDLALSAARSLLPLSRILAPHLKTRLEQHNNMSIFVYGHTHEADFDISVRPVATRRVDVLNTGAFQRLMDSETFERLRTERGMSPVEALGRFTLEDDFAPCYSLVTVTRDGDGVPKAVLEHWLMNESAVSGEFIGACDPRCGARPPRCRAK